MAFASRDNTAVRDCRNPQRIGWSSQYPKNRVQDSDPAVMPAETSHSNPVVNIHALRIYEGREAARSVGAS